jgi:AcrR family transcriptional regulator
MPASSGGKPERSKGMTSKREMTAERILDAAFRSIAAKGCGAVTLRGIAEEAGVALSQLNYYYVNKDGLFAAVLKLMKQDYAIGLDKRLRDCDALAERIKALVDYNEFLLKESPDTYRNFLEFFNFAMNSDAFRVEVAGFLSDISSMIESQITQNQMPHENPGAMSPAAITRFILSASFGISMQHFLSSGNADIDKGFEIIKATTAIILSGSRK